MSYICKYKNINSTLEWVSPHWGATSALLPACLITRSAHPNPIFSGLSPKHLSPLDYFSHAKGNKSNLMSLSIYSVILSWHDVIGKITPVMGFSFFTSAQLHCVEYFSLWMTFRYKNIQMDLNRNTSIAGEAGKLIDSASRGEEQSADSLRRRVRQGYPI